MITARDRKRAIRLVARQVSELLLARWMRWQTLLPDGRLTYVAFGSVLSASLAHQPLRDPASGEAIGLAAARDRARPVSVSAIALAMGLPPTSVRRNADALVNAGFLVRGPTGYTVAARVFADGRFAAAVAGDADDVCRALSALGDGGFEPAIMAVESGVADLPPDVVSRLLLAFALRVLETAIARHGHLATAVIVTAIVAANIRHITEDAALARNYAAEDVIPPDTVRQPVALRTLARALDIPFETVRRRVAALVADGVVVWRDNGVIVPVVVLQSESFIADNRRIGQYFEQFIAALIALTADAGVMSPA